MQLWVPLLLFWKKKRFEQITVGDIIDVANISRGTFYAHFETKQDLLRVLCQELFCHVADALLPENNTHKHLFACRAPDSVFLHLFQHINKNDNHLLDLLKSSNNELFLQYFEGELKQLIITQLPLFQTRKSKSIPEDYWIEHICVTFTHTIRWWCKNGLKESPEYITEIFLLAV